MHRYLLSELKAAYGVSIGLGYALVKSMGIDPRTTLRVSGGCIGVGHVRFISNGLYELDPYGEIALIIPTKFNGIYPEDLVAIKSNGDWARRTGGGDYLGEEQIDICKMSGDYLYVFPGPLPLLQAGWPGCVPLTKAAFSKLGRYGKDFELVAPDTSFGNRIVDGMSEPIMQQLKNLPEVRVTVPVLEAAE